MRITDGETSRAANVDNLGNLSVIVDDTAPVEVNIQTGTEVGVSDPAQVANEAGNRAFVTSTFTTTGADQEFLYLQNGDALDAILEKVVLSAAVAGVVTIALSTGTPGGAGAITPVSGELGTALARSLTANGNAEVTGLTPGAIVLAVALPAGGAIEVYLGLRIPQTEDICFSFSGTGSVSASVVLRW